MARWPFGMPGRMVDGIGKPFRFEADCGMLRIGCPALAGQRAVEIVAGVDLDAGLIGQDFKAATAGWIGQQDCRSQGSVGLPIIEYEAVIDTPDGCTLRGWGEGGDGVTQAD